MSSPPLWAPWRIDYVKSPKDGECVFCRSQQLERGDPESPLALGHSCFAVLNTFPYSSGHVLIAPKRHAAELEDLDEHELGELMGLARRATRALQSVMAPDAFNIGLNIGTDAGAGIAEHLHLHVVPRWRGDTNFMPVLAGTRVLPQALADTHAALKQAFDDQGAA